MEDSKRLKRVLEKLRALRPVSMEELLVSPDYFNLNTATPLQRAICRAVDGLPLGSLWDDPDVRSAFGGVEPAGKPIELDILSGIRAGKSLMVAALAIHWTQTCDISRLGPGEIARVSVVSLKVDLANVVFNHIVGNIQASARLRSLLVEKPSADGVVLRHPSGRPVEIRVVAGTRAGASLVSRWSAGCIFDEFTRMVGSEDGVVNYEDSRAAVIGRLLPGAQLASIGSPWASTGPAYSRYIEHFGKSGAAEIVVVKAPGWAMNPVFWTPERCQRLANNSPDVYRTDCAAEFSSPEDAFFTAEEVQRATRKEPVLEYVPGGDYVAAMDPATRSNGWTLVIASKYDGSIRVSLARQWVGSQETPLAPEVVLREIAGVLSGYRLHTCLSDQAMGDALKSLAGQAGINLVQVQSTRARRLKSYSNVKTHLSGGRLEIPPDKQLREDLLRVRKRVTATGVEIDLPVTADGRHCDYAPALALACSRWLGEPIVDMPLTEAEAVRKQLVSTVAKLKKRWGSKPRA